MRKMNLGEITAEFGPGKGNPRNSEGAFLTLRDNRILFVYCRFKGDNPADWIPADLWVVVSADGGRTFGEGRVLLTCEEEGAENIMCPSLMRMDNGDMGLFYLARLTYTRIGMFLRRSADEGLTWSERVLCTPQEGFFVVNNDRVTRLSSGRILIPAACHRAGEKRGPVQRDGTVPKNGEDIFFDSRSEAVFFYSDDDGNTWQAAEGKCCIPVMRNCSTGLQEPGVMELSPGVLWGYARTDLGRQYEMFSMDNGNTWTGAGPSRFTAPNSPLSMKRGPEGSVYAVWNPVPEYNGREKKTEIFTGGRTPLVLAVSRDNGQTFTEEAAFETEEDHGYCYCAIHFLEDGLLLAYNGGGPEDKSCLSRIKIRRIPWGELEKL